MRGQFLSSAFFALLAPTSLTSVSKADTLSLGDLNLFRAFTASNDVGIPGGDTLQFGGNILGGSEGATIQGEFTPIGGPAMFTPVGRCGPLAVNAQFCAGIVAYTSARKNQTAQVLFTRGAATGTFSLPSAADIPDPPIKFPTNVKISVDTTGAPTIAWTLPPGTNANALRVNIFEKSQITDSRTADIIESKIISPTAIELHTHSRPDFWW